MMSRADSTSEKDRHYWTNKYITILSCHPPGPQRSPDDPEGMSALVMEKVSLK